MAGLFSNPFGPRPKSPAEQYAEMQAQANAASLQNMAAANSQSPSVSYRYVFSTTTDLATTPALDKNKLEALKTAEPRKVTQRVPDLTEVITAWRAWKVMSDVAGIFLGALGQSHRWNPKEKLSATCLVTGQHPAPFSGCQCGIWSFKSLDNLIAAIEGKYQSSVIGKVSLWGRVIETENGYRAQFAYPAELWLFDNSLEELGRTYNVPIRTV
jgi:hypothetical protein